MGNSNNQEQSIVVSSSNWTEWSKVQDQGFCELWMHKKTGRQLQAYPIPETFARDTVQLRKYYFRKTNNTYLVTVQAIVTPTDTFLCSEPRMAYALIENIPCRLRKYQKSLSFQQVLYVLQAAAAGYNTLNSFFGPLQPHEDMICFNQEGKVKVWLNENLSHNEPSPSARYPPIRSDDMDMAQRKTKQCVDKLISIVELSCAEPFPSDFKEECRQVMTYFQIVNMISYYSQNHGIQVPERVIFPKQYEKSTIKTSQVQQLKREASLQNFNQSSVRQEQMDVSRVRAVVCRSNDIIPHSPHSHSASKLQRPPMNRNPFTFGQLPIQGTHPKITFNIRSTLPATIPANSPIRVAPRDKGQPLQSTAPRVDFAPPHQPQVLQKGHKRGSSSQSQETRNLHITFNPRQPLTGALQIDRGQTKPVQSLSQAKEFQEERRVQLESEKMQRVAMRQEQSKESEVLKSQENSIQDLHKSLHESRNGEHTTEPVINSIQYSVPTAQLSSLPPPASPGERNQSEEQKVPETIANILQEKPRIANSRAENMEESAFSKQSQIQSYVPPSNTFNVRSPIMEQQEEHSPSPKREKKKQQSSTEIEEWEAQLTRFTQSKHSQQDVNSTARRNVGQEEDIPESDPTITVQAPPKVQNPFSQPNQPEAQAVRELANLQSQDIQQYIRNKYNLSKKSSESQRSSQNQEPIRRIESYYEREPYKSEYSEFSYQPTAQVFQGYNYSHNYRANNYDELGGAYQTGSFKEKENFPYQYLDQPYDYKTRDRISIALSKDQTYRQGIEDISLRPMPEKKRARVSNISSNIDEKYNKYVLNGQRKNSNKYSRMSRDGPSTVNKEVHKDVSLILAGEQSKISKISSKPLRSEWDDSSKRGIDALIGNSRQIEKPGVTYEKLRNFLWED